MHKNKICMVCLWILILAITGTAEEALWSTGASENALLCGTVFAETAGAQENGSLQWFKDQMEISEKYIQEQQGIWGMTWGHFFTMVFLVLFALGALVVFVQRQRRTREILEIIRKEMQNGDSG